MFIDLSGAGSLFLRTTLLSISGSCCTSRYGQGPPFCWPVPGFILVTLNVALVGISIGMASARFRDIPQLVGSVIQIAFFMTPVMWKPELLEGRAYIVEFNPFYHLIEVMRAPLLGKPFPVDSYIALGLITIVNLLVATMFFRRFRSRIAYWV